MGVWRGCVIRLLAISVQTRKIGLSYFRGQFSVLWRTDKDFFSFFVFVSVFRLISSLPDKELRTIEAKDVLFRLN